MLWNCISMITAAAPRYGKTLLAAIFLAAAVATPSAFADTLKLSSTAYSGVGGVFTVTHTTPNLSLASYASEALYYIKGKGPANGAEYLGFGTFCLEYNEYFSSGQTLDYSLAHYASNGGKDGAAQSSQDYISRGTAWLYYNFATGQLADTLYTDATELAKFQSAIWFLEGEAPGAPLLANPYAGYATLSNTYVQMAVGALGASYIDNANGEFGVSVLNLTAGGVAKQSQLYYSSVPDAGTSLSLTALGLLALAAFRRRGQRS